MNEPCVYPLETKKRFLNFPYRLTAIGWMPHHIYFHRHAQIQSFFICISSNIESSSETEVNGVVHSTPPSRFPHFGFMLPGTNVHTIRASYHDELFFMYPASAMESFRGLFGDIVRQGGFYLTGLPSELIAEIRSELGNLEHPGTADRLDQLAVRLFSEIILRHREEMEGKSSLNLRLRSMEAELLSGRTLSSVLKDFAVSERAFYREWRSVFSMSPRKHLLRCRLENACILLAGTDLSFSEIAERCGFSSNVYFHQIFRKRLSMTPGEYRRKNRKLLAEQEVAGQGVRLPENSTE